MEEVKYEDTEQGKKGKLAQEVILKVVGLTLEAAKELITGSGLEFREKTDAPMTMDFRNDRLNLVLEDGKVVSATVG